ncbi:MAG: hypothetical protein U0326_10530 [Polyangiales bacterium]
MKSMRWLWGALAALVVVTSAATAGAQTTPAQTAPTEAASSQSRPEHETVCTGRVDEDGDGMVDCADADCFHDRACEAGGAGENTDARCSDWIDNDGDGMIDCDDQDCMGPGVTRCRGSWTNPNASTGSGTEPQGADAPLPELGPNQTAEDLIGRNGDSDGERTDETCADGLDNDGDGRTDCADFGCRFDPTVTVCQGSPSLRFSAVVGAGYTHTISQTGGDVLTLNDDVSFNRIQLRGLGPIPGVQNSFFLLNLRAERGVRLTFAMFQIPISRRWYLNINSGSGSLSTALITSAARQLLLDPAFYVYSAFEQGSGAAVEVGGALDDRRRLLLRMFASAGSGEFNGNVGGRFFRSDERNFSYNFGAQLGINLIGNYSRFDSPLMYVPVPLTLAFNVGVKWDQRPDERFVAWNAFGVFRWNRLFLSVEHYGKNEFAFGSMQASVLAQLAVLVVPRRLLFGADVGGYFPGAMSNPPAGGFSSSLPRPLQEFQYRVAAHFYFYRHVGLLSAVFSDHFIEKNPDNARDTIREQQIRLEAQFRF